MSNTKSVVEILCTPDGSHTIFVPELSEHYHSVHGARSESVHVFIKNGFNQIEKERIAVLEVGFGTGLNALLTFLNRQSHDVLYVAIEKYPLSMEILEKINFGENQSEKEAFVQIHNAKWEELIAVLPSFDIIKHQCDFRQKNLGDAKFDLVYFDAFAPDKHPDLWTEEVFTKIYDLMNFGGVLVTYCAKGIIRRMMQDIGFRVERLPGPPPKKEMLRAVKVQ